MFNCRNNLTFKPFLPFTLKLGLGDLAMESLGTGAQRREVLFTLLPFYPFTFKV